MYGAVLAASRTAFAGLQAGVCAGSLARAVAHTTTREQFGRPLSTNQGVLLRAADAHMDTEAIRVTAYEAAWRHDQGLAYGAQALTAAWWASRPAGESYTPDSICTAVRAPISTTPSTVTSSGAVSSTPIWDVAVKCSRNWVSCW